MRETSPCDSVSPDAIPLSVCNLGHNRQLTRLVAFFWPSPTGGHAERVFQGIIREMPEWLWGTCRRWDREGHCAIRVRDSSGYRYTDRCPRSEPPEPEYANRCARLEPDRL